MALASALFLALAHPAAADEPGHWGAIAYGPNGAYGTARLFADETSAAQAARQACGTKCDTVITFLRQCAALAVGKRGTGSVVRNRYRVRARDFALDACRAKDTGCKIKATVCTHTP
jgi:hypothetical protein